MARYGERRATQLLGLTGADAPRPRRVRPVAVLAAVVAAIGLAWVVWVWQNATTGAISADLVRLRPAATGQGLVVTWTLSRDPGTAVTCQVRATGGDGSTVGSLPVTVRAGQARNTQLVTDIRTVAQAVTADVSGCHVSPVPVPDSPPAR